MANNGPRVTNKPWSLSTTPSVVRSRASNSFFTPSKSHACVPLPDYLPTVGRKSWFKAHYSSRSARTSSNSRPNYKPSQLNLRRKSTSSKITGHSSTTRQRATVWASSETKLYHRSTVLSIKLIIPSKHLSKPNLSSSFSWKKHLFSITSCLGRTLASTRHQRWCKAWTKVYREPRKAYPTKSR